MIVDPIFIGITIIKIFVFIGLMPVIAAFFLWPSNDQPTSAFQWATFVVAVLLTFDILFTHFIDWISLIGLHIGV